MNDLIKKKIQIMLVYNIPQIIKTSNPTIENNISEGYPLGQKWFNSITGEEFLHKSTGVWVTQGGSKTSGTNYYIVQGNGTPLENYNEFVSIYQHIFTTKSPSATNKFTIILNPGYYDGIFRLNKQHINVVAAVDKQVFCYGIDILVNNIGIKGLVVENRGFYTFSNSSNIKCVNHRLNIGDPFISNNVLSTNNTYGRLWFVVNSIIDNDTITLIDNETRIEVITPYVQYSYVSYGVRLGNNLPNVTCENVIVNGFGGFQVDISSKIDVPRYISGTFIGCETNEEEPNGLSWGKGEVLSGTFINCKGVRMNTGGSTTGMFNNIIVKMSFSQSSHSEDYEYIIHSGNYDNIRILGSGGFYGQCTGVFNNCHINGSGFGTSTTSNPKLLISTGTFTNCVAGVFSYTGTYSSAPHATLGKSRFAGKAYNCVGGWGSFGGLTPDAGMDGVLVNCYITQGTNLASYGTTLPFFKNIKPRLCTLTSNGVLVVTYTNHSKIKGDAIRFSAETSLPIGLQDDKDYYVLELDFTLNSFKVSEIPNGTPVSVTDAGVGELYVHLGRYINCIDGTGKIINSPLQ